MLERAVVYEHDCSQISGSLVLGAGERNACCHASPACTHSITQTSFRPNYVALKGAILLYSIDSVDSRRDEGARPAATSLFILSLLLIKIWQNGFVWILK